LLEAAHAQSRSARSTARASHPQVRKGPGRGMGPEGGHSWMSRIYSSYE
jgi:hypothetical protein